ncbi:hypothetical protein [Tabrizicola sp.]|uniref:hypothetical protein n=1 Tax=Tabrizicola sp. TaxID=2005166 RepID=UPI002FDD6072
MSNSLSLDLWNAILPLAVLCGLVAFLPGWFAGRGCLSQRVLAWAVVKTAFAALMVGAGLAVTLYAAINNGVLAGIAAAPLERMGFFLGRSALFALLWGPVLGFVWLVKAQEMNRRIGMRMMDEGGKG